MNIVVSGIHTDVGKTVVSAILCQLLQCSYKKPVQIGQESDTQQIEKWLPEIEHFSSDFSVIETFGGFLSPTPEGVLGADIFSPLPAKWILVSRHYLGSINHTLLTCRALAERGITPAGIIFNGEDRFGAEKPILHYTQLPLLGRLREENTINTETIKRYACLWQKQIQKAFGIPTLKKN